MVLKFWNMRKTKNIKYSTDIPKIIRQMAGWGLVNGPFGNVSTDTMQKKTITQQMPAQMFSSIFVSFLREQKEEDIKIRFLSDKKNQVPCVIAGHHIARLFFGIHVGSVSEQKYTFAVKKKKHRKLCNAK